MISVILYGRNDSYGYNLHKRAALSLNCISQILTEPDDELIFVDYNSPNDYPTFPEAIQDTLTDVAKERLRVLRVRPELHAQFKPKSHLVALEPIARNIAIRRSNPNNRWILSTNTDMIFVPHKGNSLSAPLRDLAPGFYHLPRFEIPETLWETFDRMDADGTINAVRHWASAAHLNEIVEASPLILFDGPGDFQLVQRDDFFRIHGFDEEMLLGWHVDSNIAKRLFLLHGGIGHVMDHMFGYHCDHTRQVTPAHRGDSVSNSIQKFFEDVVVPEKATQNGTWGFPKHDVEEISLRKMRNFAYLDGLKSVLPEPMVSPTKVAYVTETYEKTTYDPRHVLPFAADIFVNAPVGTRIAWIGGNRAMLTLFARLWSAIGISENLLLLDEFVPVLDGPLPPNVEAKSFQELRRLANAFIFDFSVSGDTTVFADQPSDDDARLLQRIADLFVELVDIERELMRAGADSRRFVCINAIHNSAERLANSFLSAARTPFSSRIRQGFVVPGARQGSNINVEIDWTRLMLPAGAGIATNVGIMSTSRSGHVMYGPFQTLSSGLYRATVLTSLEDVHQLRSVSATDEVIVIEIVAGEQILARKSFTRYDLQIGLFDIDFEILRKDIALVSAQGLQVRLWTCGRIDFTIRKVVATGLDPSTASS
jgi:hypothetical protein